PIQLQWLVDSKAGNLSEILFSINAAKTQHEERKNGSVMRKSLTNLAEKIHHYGSIMDVLVQHHPEYASLAWGVMKVLFVGVVNHEKLLLELTVQLFPNRAIRADVVSTYAYILKFLIRALRWFKESRLSHAIHSITRPSELRYDDLIEKIQYLSRNIAELAAASSQAELRNMHILQQKFISNQVGFQNEQRQFQATQMEFSTEIRNELLGRDSVESKLNFLSNAMVELRELMVAQQVLHSSAEITIKHEVPQAQLAEILPILISSNNRSLPDPEAVFQSSLILRNQRRRRKATSGPPFWLQPKIQSWNQSQTSSLIMVKGTRKSRFHLKNFLTDSISQLLDRSIPVIWTITAGLRYHDDTLHFTTIDLLKCVISQAITLNPSLHNDAFLSQHIERDCDAVREADYFDILASIVQSIPLLYIFMDIELISFSPAHSEAADFTIPKNFLELFSELKRRGINTVIKVNFVSYGSSVFVELPRIEERQLVVPLANTSKKATKRLATRNKNSIGGRLGKRGGSMVFVG
ncbi:hypothetical protein HYALB_00009289, partial [Hymenoscyphus albidus]